LTGPVDRLSDFVEALLRDRRPPRYPAEADEAPGLVGAAALKAARPGADLPSRDFIDGLEQRLGAEVSRGAQVPARGRGVSRRTLLQLTGASAAAAVAGVLVDRVVSREEPRPPERVVASSGRWIAVVSAAELVPGRAVRFSTPAIEGFVVNHGGDVRAMSAVCTHMGCILQFNPGRGRLDCPCHGASFALDGSPIQREYLQALPQLRSRVRGGTIEVEVPAQA
jgi:cytochrome b6-f complex iron-sulfur subunit